MNNPSENIGASALGSDYADHRAEREDALARAQLSDGLHEIAEATTDAIDSVREAIAGNFADIAQTLRALVRARPFTAIATTAGVAYVYARIRR